MPNTAKRLKSQRQRKTSKRKAKKGGQKNKLNLRRKRHHVHGGNCGCGKVLGGGVGCSGLSKTNNLMTGGGNSPFQPSFSGLPISKFYSLNEYGNDPTHMSMATRLNPDIPHGMSTMRGGKGSKKNKDKYNKTKKQIGKKMRGGINPGALLSNFNSMILGNGLPDNIVASQGNVTGTLIANSIYNGDHQPLTGSSFQLNKLYNDQYPPLA